MSLKPVLPGGFVQVPAGGGGGSPITDPNIAYIRSDGNDATGNGSPSAPYLTAQAAVDAGFTTLDLGVGSFGNIAWLGASSRTIRICGRGTVTTLTTVQTFGGDLTIVDIGTQSVAINAVTTATTAPTASGSITLTNVLATTVDASGSSAVGSGVDGSNAGSVTLNGLCRITNLEATGGDTVDTTAGNGGSVVVNGPSVVVTTLVVSTGSGGAPGTDGSVEVRASGTIPTPTPDAATVQGAIINGIFYTNTYP
jgi:hypothetical protein